MSDTDFDALSDVIRSIRLKSAVFFDVTAASPWVAESRSGQALARTLMLAAGHAAAHLIDYHFVTRGECWVAPADHSWRPVRLGVGDIVAFPRGDPHLLSGSPELTGARPAPIPASTGTECSMQVRIFVGDGAKGVSAQLICGFLACDVRPFNPLVGSLPPFLHVRAAESDRWVECFAACVRTETAHRRAGSASMLAKLGELMFVDLVRRHIETLPAGDHNWLAGLRDRQVGRAFALIHADPAGAWTLDELARQVGASRSSFAGRFSRYAGMPPMQYLKKWRMQLASSMLVETAATVSQVAGRVGYDSEEAFSRAFKRIVGISPSHWREANRPTPLGQRTSVPGSDDRRSLPLAET